MKVITPGHTYMMYGNKGTASTTLQFYMDPAIHGGVEQAGTTNQEVARVLIDRLLYLEDELPWGGDLHMVDNLRDLIIMHEVRAGTRKGLCSIELMVRLTTLNRQWLVATGRGIEQSQPRRNGHIYPEDCHLAATCGGKCERLTDAA